MSFFLHLEDWRGWHSSEAVVIHDPGHRISAQPGTDLPAMLRRRLDDAGRATCEILKALDPDADLPLIFASRHGNTPQTFGMLETVANSEPISPARFSMSVHNATLGVHSIACAHHRPLQALGACGDEFDAILHEARGYLTAGYRAVVAVLAESPLAAAYHGHTEHPGTACAVGIRLSLNRGRKLTATHCPYHGAPTPVEVMAWLNGDTLFLSGRQQWQLKSE